MNRKLVRGIVAVVMVSGLFLGPLAPKLLGRFGVRENDFSQGHVAAVWITPDGWAGGRSSA